MKMHPTNATDEWLGLNEYQRSALRTDQNGRQGLEGLSFALLGLFGEVGTLLSALKRKQRDRDSFADYTQTITEEFGDVLWYFSNIASRAALNLSVLAQRVSREFEDWDEVGVDEFGTFDDIQPDIGVPDAGGSATFEASLLALAGKTGLLLNDFEGARISSNRDVLSAHLVEILRVLIQAADAAGINLAHAAALNVEKINSRWPGPGDEEFGDLFDEACDPLEQIPRKIVMHIFEKERGGRVYVFQRCNGINIGSALTDNRAVNDDYRFHDVFHLAYAAVLGWSPVVRTLFNVKRKSNPAIDENEDGARAILIEEGLSTLIFNRASEAAYFESIASMDYSLLKLVSEFVSGYEVSIRPLWQWERAILSGFEIFRQLRRHRRGIVTADLVARSISFEELPV